MKKTCSRCSNNFECHSEKINECFCSSVHLTKNTQSFLAKTNYDCLCENCLLEINELVKQSVDKPFPKRGETLTENIHYYIENGNWVFTEFYHLLRGNCCGNKCRHCAYGIHK